MHSARLQEVLIELGRQQYGQFPWHVSRDPFRVLIAEILLTRTKRVVVARIFRPLFAKFPTSSDLAAADVDELSLLLRPVGLFHRTRRLRLVAQAIELLGGVPDSRTGLRALPEVGEYVADATLLYAFDSPAFPLDKNVQRVLTRVWRGITTLDLPPPYKDDALRARLLDITADKSTDALRWLHQGVLAVAWSHCGSHPHCGDCPLVNAG